MIVSQFASILLIAAADEANPLAWKSDLALWTAVVFVVLLAVLWKFAWKPIAEGLDKREKQIADQIAEAERQNRDARQLLDEYQQRLAASQGEVRGILDQARREAEQTGREMLEKARNEGRAEHARALQQIEAATAGALQELAQRSATLAVELAGKIVGSQLTAERHAELIQEAVAEFTGEKSS
jgi:F-type H+-transporting ATPase subunit b